MTRRDCSNLRRVLAERVVICARAASFSPASVGACACRAIQIDPLVLNLVEQVPAAGCNKTGSVEEQVIRSEGRIDYTRAQRVCNSVYSGDGVMVETGERRRPDHERP